MKNKKGQYKSFLHLAMAWDMKYGKNKVYDAIMSASVASGLHNLRAKDQNRIIYEAGSEWLQVVKHLTD